MSETVKATDTTKRATDQAARSGQAGIEAASRTTKDSINETSQAAQHATDRAKEIGQSMTETVAETANAATNMSSKAAEQSREAMMMGVRTAAGSLVLRSNRTV